MRKSIHDKRAERVRRKLKKSNSNRFRLSVFRSSRNISAQIIDDDNNKTLVSASSLKKTLMIKIKKATCQFMQLNCWPKKR